MIAVVATIQRGRRAHLDRQVQALAGSSLAPVAHVVVSMDDEPPTIRDCDVIHHPHEAGAPLPLAAARNHAIRHASDRHGADLVILLDVDCLPAPMMVGRYLRASVARPGRLLAGAVRYLPAGIPRRGAIPTLAELATAPPHPARPAPPPGLVVDEPRIELFWSLSFAVTPTVHERIGGFDEAYEGYGGEDTDYARRALRADVPLAWVGGAEAYHQHHPVSSPPVEHLGDIVRNARRFHARWNAWPMHGWLSAFHDRGLIDWRPGDGGLSLTARGRATAGVHPLAVTTERSGA